MASTTKQPTSPTSRDTKGSISRKKVQKSCCLAPWISWFSRKMEKKIALPVENCMRIRRSKECKIFFGGYFFPYYLGIQRGLFFFRTSSYKAANKECVWGVPAKNVFFLLMQCAFSHILHKIFKISKIFKIFKIFKKCQIRISAIKKSPMIPIKWGFMGKNAHPPLVCS